MSIWTIADAEKIVAGDIDTITTPQLKTTFKQADPSYFFTGYSYLQNIGGEPFIFNGYYIMVASSMYFTAGTSSKLDQMENYVKNQYPHIWYSTDNINWTCGSVIATTYPNIGVYPGMMRIVIREGTPNTVDIFYSVFDQGTDDLGYDVAKVMYYGTGTLSISNNSVQLSGFATSTSSSNIRPLASNVFLYPDDINCSSWYLNNNAVFETPTFFVKDELVYCLYSCSVPNSSGTRVITDAERGNIFPGYVSPAEAIGYCGAIGIASMTLSNYKLGNLGKEYWTMYPPLITTVGVTARPYLPSIVFDNDKTYIFFNSDSNAIIETGLYGFVSYNGLFGDYEPLNDCGNVLRNPATSPDQTYYWQVDSNFSAYGTIYQVVSDDQIYTGGTQSPVHNIIVDGNKTYIGTIPGYTYPVKPRDWSNIWTNSSGNSLT